jgi:hypothetical protein
MTSAPAEWPFTRLANSFVVKDTKIKKLNEQHSAS